MAATPDEMTTVSPQPSKPEPPQGEARPGNRANLVLLALLLAVLVGLVSGAYQISEHRTNARDNQLRTSAIEAATQVATDLTSMTPQTTAAGMKKLIGETTGAFRDQFSQQEGMYSKLLAGSQVSSTGSVVHAGAEDLQPDKASVLVAAGAAVKNSEAPNGQRRIYRMRISLLREGDRWLASNMELVP
jgi:Mce-associated membrane protein